MPKKSRNITRGPKSGISSSSSSKPPDDAPKRAPLTHFLCILLVNDGSKPQLEASLQHFRSKMHEFVPLLPAKAVRPVGTLHLTLGVMSLMGEEREADAVGLLKSLDLSQMLLDATKDAEVAAGSSHLESCGTTASSPATSPKAVSPPPTENLGSKRADSEGITVSLTALHSMHSPQKTSVLYASPADPTARLYPFCNTLRQLFTAEGYIVPEDRPLKLHATIVNTKYVKAGGRNQAPLRVDAIALMEAFEEFIWADGVTVEKVAICKMGARKIFGDGGVVIGEEYEEVASAVI